MTAMALEVDWKTAANRAIEREASTGRQFDAMDLQERYKLPDAPHPNQWGPAFQSAAKRGLIQVVGYHRSRRPGRAGGVCAVWQGVPEQRGMLL